jgi:hypothetical protein
MAGSGQNTYGSDAYTDTIWKPGGQDIFGGYNATLNYGSGSRSGGGGYFGNGGDNLLNKDSSNAWQNFSQSSGNWSGGGGGSSWGDTGWGKGVIGASKFLKNYFDQNPNLSNRYSGGDPYGRGNVPWGSPANVASSWSQLGSTFKDLGYGNSVETYPTSHQIGYQPGTPGRPGWGSTALGIAGGLASAIFPMAAPVIAPLTGALSSGMSAFNI